MLKWIFFISLPFFCPPVLRNMINVCMQLADSACKFACGARLCTCIAVLWIRFSIRIRIRRIYMIFGPPVSASGSVSRKYGYGSGSFHPQAKIEKKTFFSMFCDLTFLPMLRIRIRLFLGHPDPHPDPLYRDTDPRMRRIVPVPCSH